MKIKSKHRPIKAILSVLLTMCILMGVTSVAFIPANASVTTFLLGEVKAWGVTYAKKALIAGVNSAGSEMGVDSKYTKFVDNLILGPSASKAAETLAVCQEILTEVKEIQKEVEETNKILTDFINNYNLDKLDDYFSDFKTLSNTYAEEINLYNILVSAEQEYATCLEKGEDYQQVVNGVTLKNQDVIDAYLQQLGWYKSTGSTQYLDYNFLNNALYGIANEGSMVNKVNALIPEFSAYDASSIANYPTELLSSSPTGSFKYYETVMDVANNSSVYTTQAEKSDFIIACVNAALMPTSQMMYYARLANSFFTEHMIIHPEEIPDSAVTSQTESTYNPATTVAAYNGDYHDMYNKMTNALNQMLDKFTPIINGLMRSYDIEQKTQMKHSDKGSVCVGTMNDKYRYTDSTADIKTSKFDSYMFVPAGANRAYKLLNTWSGSNKIKTNQLFSYREDLQYDISAHQTASFDSWFEDQDFENIFRTQNNDYYLYRNYTDLFVPDIFDESDEHATSTLYEYLNNHIVPDSSMNNMYNIMLTDEVDYDDIDTGTFVAHDAEANNKIRVIYTDKSEHSYDDYIEMEQLQHVNSTTDTSPVIVLYGQETDNLYYNLKYSANTGGSIAVYNTYEETYEPVYNNPGSNPSDYDINYKLSGSVNSNTTTQSLKPLYVEVAPQDGYELHDVTIYNSDGEEIFTIADEQTCRSAIEKNGKYMFSTAMPCQNCEIKANYVPIAGTFNNSNVSVTFENQLYANGKEQIQKIKSVIFNNGYIDVNLSSSDYEVIGNIVKLAGKYTMTVKGKNRYSGEATVNFEVYNPEPSTEQTTVSSMFGETMATTAPATTTTPQATTSVTKPQTEGTTALTNVSNNAVQTGSSSTATLLLLITLLACGGVFTFFWQKKNKE